MSGVLKSMNPLMSSESTMQRRARHSSLPPARRRAALPLGLACVLSLAMLPWSGCGDDTSQVREPAPTAATVRTIRGETVLHLEDEGEEIVDGQARVEIRSDVRTAADGRAHLQHDSGGWILLDRDSTLRVIMEGAALSGGRAFFDTRRGELQVTAGDYVLRANGATFAVDVRTGAPQVYCGSGEVTWQSEQHSGQLMQGETLTLSGTPTPEAARLWEDWTGGLADAAPWRAPDASYIGVLVGREPHEIGKARRALSSRAHEVDVAIRGDLAETTVTQTFFNAESAVLEAHYRMRLPEGAIVSGFEVDMGDGFVPGQVRSQIRPGESVHYGHPIRLSYDGPERVRAFVPSVGPGATVRIRLRYHHWMKRQGAMRSYVYPMVDVGAESPLIGELRIRVDTRGNNLRGVRAGMGAEMEDGQVVLRRSDYRPTSDFHLDLIDVRDAPRNDAVVYLVDAPPAAEPVQGPGAIQEDADLDQFGLFEVPIEALSLPEQEAAPLDLAVVVDVSGATQEEDLELARAVVESALRQLAPTDRITVLLGDVRAHAPETLDGEFLPATAENGERLLEALAHAPLGGATDLAETLRGASVLAAGRRRAAVLYLGDGRPSTGPMDASAIATRLATVEAPPRLFALALGERHNLDLLRRVTDHAEAVVARTDAARAVMRLLAEAARPTLRQADIELGATVERVFPRLPRTVHLDAPIRLMARVRGALPASLTVTGIRDGESIEVDVPLRTATLEDGGDVQRRWAAARLQELIDADAGREALVALGQRFSLLTPWTSMVVGIGGGPVEYLPIPSFDPPAPPISTPRSGWRRRRPESEPSGPIGTVAERTWEPRVRPVATASGGMPSGDGGLSQASVRRTLETHERGPRACYERRLIVRPDLQGRVQVSVNVGADGDVREVAVQSSSLGQPDVESCIAEEVRGLRFGATESAVTVTYTYDLRADGGTGRRRVCSDASRQSLALRRVLWEERLTARPGDSAGIWWEALRQCELSSWSARRVLLELMVRHTAGLRPLLALYRALRREPAAASYLRRAALRRVRTPQDVQLVRRMLGLIAPVDWDYFSRRWHATRDPRGRLRLVRRWLQVLEGELDLRLRELALLEELGRLEEARRLARELRADPLADAAVYAAVGEFFLRQGDEGTARRVFSELVENAPRDPWARRRLGDLYRAHGWHDDAYREYSTLARLMPSDPGVLLLLARAAEGAGRIDEALRLQQRLSERSEPGKFEGVAGIARLWTLADLSALSEREVDGDALRERIRSTGLLRDTPDVVVMLTWSHPEDAPRLLVNLPSTPEDVPMEAAPLDGGAYGMRAALVPELEESDVLRFSVRRDNADGLRDVEASLWVVTGFGSDAMSVTRESVTLTRDASTKDFRLEQGTLRAL